VFDAVGQLVIFARHAKKLLAKSSDGQVLGHLTEPDSLISVMR
jgi:hypothetical protein